MALENKEKIVDRIRKLFAKAEKAGSVEEAATFAASAERMMRKFQLEQTDLLVHEIEESGEIVGERIDHVSMIYGEKYKAEGKKPPQWVRCIAVGVAEANDAVCFTSDGSIRFWGLDVDVEVCIEMTRYLLKEVHRLARAFQGNRTAKSNFRAGCAGILQDRLFELGRERHEEFAGTTNGTALVELKQALIVQKTGFTGWGSHQVSVTDSNGFFEGEAAGKNISLHKQLGRGEVSGYLQKN